MSTNVANWERIIRIALGLILVSLVFVGPQTLWGWAGLILVATGAVGTCPIYSVLGFSTCPTPKHG
jgi:hypothetical protein